MAAAVHLVGVLATLPCVVVEIAGSLVALARVRAVRTTGRSRRRTVPGAILGSVWRVLSASAAPVGALFGAGRHAGRLASHRTLSRRPRRVARAHAAQLPSQHAGIELLTFTSQ